MTTENDVKKFVKTHESFKGRGITNKYLECFYWTEENQKFRCLDFDDVLEWCNDCTLEGWEYFIVYKKDETLCFWEGEEDLKACWVITINAQTLYG